jgi:hypothetical protein
LTKTLIRLISTYRVKEISENNHELAMKSSIIEILPCTPQYEKIYQTLYKDRLKSTDEVDFAEFGYDFEYLKDNFSISAEELNAVTKVLSFINQ